MPATTTPPRDADSTPSAEAPESTAERLEHEAADAADELRATVAEILERLDGVRELADEVREAGVAFGLRRVAAELLGEIHDVDVDLPDLDVDARLADVEDALEAVAGLWIRGDSASERRARSARNQLQNLRQAVRRGDPDEAASRAGQLRRLLGGPGWIAAEAVEQAFLAPARARRRKSLEARLVGQALRVARSFGQGNPVPLRDEDGEPVRFPASVTRLLEEQIDAPRDFRSLFLDAIEHPKHRDVSGRDLEAEVADAASRLSDEELAEVVE